MTIEAVNGAAARFFAALAMIASLWATEAQAARPLNPQEFTQAVVEALAKQDPPIEAQASGLLSVQMVGGRPGKTATSLNLIYREYLKSPKDFDAIVRRLVDGVHGAVAAPEFTREDRLNILPIFRSEAWMRDVGEKAAAGGTLIAEKWGRDLYLLYGVEREGVTAFLREEDLLTVAVPPRAIKELASRNLARLAEGHQTHSIDQFWVIEVDRKHEAGLLLLNEFWDNVYLGFTGDIVAAIPKNGLLAIGNAEEWDQVDKLRQMAEREFAKENYGVSPRLFIRKEGRFYPYGGSGERPRPRAGPRRSFWFWD